MALCPAGGQLWMLYPRGLSWDQRSSASLLIPKTTILSAPSESLQSWRPGQSWAMDSQKHNEAQQCQVQGFAPGSKQSQTCGTGSENKFRAALWGTTWRSWWMKIWTWASSVSLQTRKPAISWAASKDGLPAWWGRLSLFTLHSWGLICSTVSRPGPQPWEIHGAVGCWRLDVRGNCASRHRLPREAVDAPSLEMFKTRLDGDLGSLIWWVAALPVSGN